MHDFVSEFWSWYIIIPTILGILGCVVLLLKASGALSHMHSKHAW